MPSAQAVNPTPLGRVACRCSTNRFTASLISISFSCLVDITLMPKLGSPLKKAKLSTSANPSRMVAMSPRVTRVPSGRVRRTISSNSAPVYAWPFVRSRISPDSERMAPPGRSTDQPRTARATWSRVRPVLAQCVFGDLDGNLERAGTHQLGVGHLGQADHLLANPFRELLERGLVEVAVYL